MNLADALDVVATPLRIPVRSNRQLIDTLHPFLSGHARAHPVPRLHRDHWIRPVDLLRALAVATRPRYQHDVHDAYAQWALLRYLGVFARAADGSCRLSAAGRRIAGRQRGVLSEELSIGLAALLSCNWLASAGALGATVDLIDVDVLIDSGAAWISKASGSKRRPDYLVVHRAPDIRMGLVECKGTKVASGSARQLCSAHDQLGSLLVNGAPARGLAVSAIVADNAVSCAAIQRMPPLTGGSGEILSDDVVPLGWLEAWWGGPMMGEDDVPTFHSALDVRVDARESRRAGAVDPESVVSAVLAASWSIIAEFGGNDEGLQRWSDSRLNRRGGAERRRRIATSYGEDIVVRGVSNVVALPGGRLEVVFGLLDYVDDALTAGSSTDVIETQARVRRQSVAAEPRSADDDQSPDEVIAIGPDGTAMLLRRLG